MSGQLVWTSRERRRLEAVRSALGHSQATLGELLHTEFGLDSAVPQASVSKIIDGRIGRPSNEILAAVSRYVDKYGADVSEAEVDQASIGDRTNDPESRPLAFDLQEELRARLVREVPQMLSAANRESVKLVRQLAEWADLPSSALADGLSDLMSE